ncbi:hypothetical protein [Gloeothece verrucosa]|uniref:Uncharacterized protein n=1 Tax=Gloeothece verrucosa (strain PCC 7822) TaxID=497965 RepID=E0U9N9_GLOV7|nr:hypothetical protein [Gloeothece verrucosa]ADN13840.1 hypothetical protein Cyan7822_1855 [Gloeothece verrucosa PCC 7822]
MSNSSVILPDNLKTKEIKEPKDRWTSGYYLVGQYKPADLKSGYAKFPSVSSSKSSSARSLQEFKRPNNAEKIKPEQRDLSLASAGYLDSQSVLLIKEYFAYSPYERVKLSKNYARNIKSVDEVFAVLQLGTARGIKEAYDGATALLAECSTKVLSQTVDKIRRELISNPLAIKKYEDDLEILITAIACSQKISTKKKERLINLFVQHSNRTVKAAIIDAFRILEGEINSEAIIKHLKPFTSDQEPDEYIRRYAEEAISDLD